MFTHKFFKQVWGLFILSLFFMAAQVGAQNVSSNKSQPHDTKQNMQKVTQKSKLPAKSSATTVDPLVKQVDEIVLQSDNLLKSLRAENAQEKETAMKDDTHRQMMDMATSINDIAKNMQKTSSQLETVLSDQKQMKSAGMKKHMDDMHKNMMVMAKAMNGMIKSLDQLNNKPLVKK